MHLTASSFLKHLHTLHPSRSKVLLAVSGGIDSMVLLHLMDTSDIPFAVAHVNYRLRGGDSDADMHLVEQVCQKLNRPLFLKVADDNTLMSLRHSSTQEKAREIRYSWMHDLLSQTGASHILTAHQSDDQAETMFHHFIRGSGLEGLRGMEENNERVLRPLLPFSRNEITDFAHAHHILWREDISNAENHYTRNIIRNEIFPLIRKINSSLTDTLASHSRIYKEAAALIAERVNQDIRAHTMSRSGEIRIPLKWLETCTYPHLFLWEVLKNKGFHSAQVDGVIRLTHSISGSRIQSATHCVWKDRGQLVVTDLIRETPQTIVIDEHTTEVSLPDFNLVFVHDNGQITIDSSADQAQFDREKLTFPLTLRTWREGDRIRPWGMEGSKKISDLLIQLKVPQYRKKMVYVLESGGVIAWVVGMRTSREFAIDDSTRHILTAQVKRNPD